MIISKLNLKTLNKNYFWPRMKFCLDCRQKKRKSNKVQNKNYTHLIREQGYCVDCGRRQQLQFDHVIKNKSFDICGGYKKSFLTLTKEISKCVIRCESCHIKRHRSSYNRIKLLGG